MEATSGFEPLNRGFADLPLNHLGTSPRRAVESPAAPRPAGGEPALCRLSPTPSSSLPGFPARTGCPSRIRTSPNGSKVRCPTTRRRASGYRGPVQGKRWSGRRDSNPRPSPWQGDALPTEPLPLENHASRIGAESQDRTGDTAIFSRVLYQLSYLGPVRRTGCPSARRKVPRRTETLQGRRTTADLPAARPACGAPRSLPTEDSPAIPGRSIARWHWAAAANRRSAREVD